MIIWGSKVRDIQVGNGHFYCPSCQADRSYAKQRYARYFTLYFIPLFQTDNLGEYIRCGGCRGEYKTSVLQYSREQIRQATSPWSCGGCGNANAPGTDDCLNCGRARQDGPPALPAEDGASAEMQA